MNYPLLAESVNDISADNDTTVVIRAYRIRMALK